MVIADFYNASQSQIEACLRRMRAGPFKRIDVVETAVLAGVPRKWGIPAWHRPAARLAARLIQQERKAGHLRKTGDRSGAVWEWIT